jgi:phosphohistidine phosphatase SixA
MGLAPWLPSQAADPAPAFVEKRITAEQFKDILKGGFVLYLRHGYTDNRRGDRVPSVDLDDCTTQRTLSDDGRELMKRVGKSMRDAKVPLNEILVSPMCRTKESAQLAIGDKFTLYEPLMYSANMTSEEKKPRIEALKKLLAAPVAAGGNRLLVAHAPNLADLIGFFVKPEGNVVVFRPLGAAGYEYIGSIHPGDWAGLAK